MVSPPSINTLGFKHMNLGGLGRGTQTFDHSSKSNHEKTIGQISIVGHSTKYLASTHQNLSRLLKTKSGKLSHPRSTQGNVMTKCNVDAEWDIGTGKKICHYIKNKKPEQNMDFS